MTRAIHLISIQLMCLLAACAEPAVEADATGGVEQSTGDTGEPALGEIELCDASEFRPLVGTLITEAGIEASASLRVFGVNDIITQDYVPQRTNVVYDEDGMITRAYCG